MGACSGVRIGFALVMLLVMLVIFLFGALIMGVFAGAGYDWAEWGQGLYYLGGIAFIGYVTYLIGFSCEKDLRVEVEIKESEGQKAQ